MLIVRSFMLVVDIYSNALLQLVLILETRTYVLTGMERMSPSTRGCQSWTRGYIYGVDTPDIHLFQDSL